MALSARDRLCQPHLLARRYEIAGTATVVGPMDVLLATRWGLQCVHPPTLMCEHPPAHRHPQSWTTACTFPCPLLHCHNPPCAYVPHRQAHVPLARSRPWERVWVFWVLNVGACEGAVRGPSGDALFPGGQCNKVVASVGLRQVLRREQVQKTHLVGAGGPRRGAFVSVQDGEVEVRGRVR